MGKLTGKLKSSTLIEVIVGLVIITITFALIFKLITNLNRSENLRLKTNASLLMDEIIANTREELNFIDDEFDYGYLHITKSVQPYQSSENLMIINLEAFDRDNRMILEKKVFVLNVP